MLPIRTPARLSPLFRRGPARTVGLAASLTVALGLSAIAGVATASAAVAAQPAAHGIVAVVAASNQVSSDRAEPLDDLTLAARASLQEALAALTDAGTTTAAATASGLDLGTAPTTIETAELRENIDALSTIGIVPVLLLPALAEDAADETGRVTAQTEALRMRLDAAEAQRAAEQAAAEAAAEAAAQAQRDAEAAAAALAAANTPEGAKAAASQIAVSEFGWGADQFSCLVSLWERESNWNYAAYNADGGATGIPQALPGSKMASAGADWQTNAVTQIRWGLGYIAAVYGAPCAAWGHSQSTNWY